MASTEPFEDNGNAPLISHADRESHGDVNYGGDRTPSNQIPLKTPPPGADRGSHHTKIGPKSLIFCLVLNNPFDPEKISEQKSVDENLFGKNSRAYNAALLLKTPTTGGADDNDQLASTASGAYASRTAVDIANVSFAATARKKGASIKQDANTTSSGQFGSSGPIQTFLDDDDFLLTQNDRHHPGPNDFQKVIEVILRLQARGLDILPENMLTAVPESESGRPNYFHGFALNEATLLTSPDKDEMYIKIHAHADVLLAYAEHHSIPLLSHNFSFGGGAALPYSKDLEKKLSESVDLYHSLFHLTANQYSPGKANGFYFDPQHKLRILVRYIREQWRFGGCGLQIAEMRKKKILVRNFFPLHNKFYLDEHGLTKWASFKSLISFSPLKQDHDAICCYFGEQIGLYFRWIRQYTIVLSFLAVCGVVTGVVGQIISRALVNAIFSVICVIWAAYWNLHWARQEAQFAIENCQIEQLEQEPVRDEFRCDALVPVAFEDIYEMNFKYPLSLQTNTDGSMVNLYYPGIKRLLVRYLISYPIILILTAAMLVSLTYNNYWRFQYPDNSKVSFATSIIAVVAANIFGIIFDKMVEFLNYLENNRTDTEEESEKIQKSFLFSFFSFYFSLFIIVLWPLEGPQSLRLKQLESQMIIICIVKPMVQNIIELVTPYVMAELRIRVDAAGGFCGALGTLCRCRPTREVLAAVNLNVDDEGTKLWLEAQQEPYESTAGDYLEITLQFGYMAMFASTFPWAAVAAFFYNALELRVDAHKLVYFCQRPMAKPAATIGPWRKIFVIITLCAVITNCYLVCSVSPVYKHLGIGEDVSDSYRWKSFVVLQYALVVTMMVLYALVQPTPGSYYKLQAKRQLLSSKALRQRARVAFEERLQQAAGARATNVV